MSHVLWLCSFALATERGAGDHGIPLAPAFEDAEGVGLSAPVFLASTGKPVPMTKKQIL